MEQGWTEWRLGDLLASRPAIRVNQFGYLPDGPKQAVLVGESSTPTPFTLVDDRGRTVFSGTSSAAQFDASSGLTVQVLDFSAVQVTGSRFRVRTSGSLSHDFAIQRHLYRPLAVDALRFFYLQRSGCAIDPAAAPGYGRPAGHAGRHPNRGDTAVPAWTGTNAQRLYPGWRCSGAFDVSGGWYDAGDFGKYVTSGGVALWQLLATIDLIRRRPTSEWSTTLEQDLVRECRWQLDWMLRMQVPRGQPLAGMAFHRVHGTEWSALPMWPHEDPVPRVLHRPSTAATLHLAGTAAYGARLFAQLDSGYAQYLLAAATTAYAAARREPRLLAPNDQGAFGGGPYDDDVVDDEFYWAAAELWLTTGSAIYRSDWERSPLQQVDVFGDEGFDGDEMAAPAVLSLAVAGGGVGNQAAGRLIAAADRVLDLQAQQPWGQPYAPVDGWAWGSNGRILNLLVVLASAWEAGHQPRHRRAALLGLDYLLGRNPLGQCYITGYGPDDSHHQRTRHFARDLDPAFPPPPPGAVAGGPCSRDNPGFPSDQRLADLPPQLCYLDEPTSEVTNDVCIRWNAPLVWLATWASGLW